MLDHGEGPRESGYAQMKLQPLLHTFLYASRLGYFSLLLKCYNTLKKTEKHLLCRFQTLPKPKFDRPYKAIDALVFV